MRQSGIDHCRAYRKHLAACPYASKLFLRWKLGIEIGYPNKALEGGRRSLWSEGCMRWRRRIFKVQLEIIEALVGNQSSMQEGAVEGPSLDVIDLCKGVPRAQLRRWLDMPFMSPRSIRISLPSSSAMRSLKEHPKCHQIPVGATKRLWYQSATCLQCWWRLSRRNPLAIGASEETPGWWRTLSWKTLGLDS